MSSAQQASISTSFSPSSMSSTMPQVQSLPTVLPESFNSSDKILEIRSAYSMTLLLEHDVSSNTGDPKIRERKLIHARVLGHLLREAPSMRATENVADQVNSCQNNDQLDALGEMYFFHYICAFRISKNEDSDDESLPPSPPAWDRPYFETKRELVEHMLRTDGDPSQCSEEARRRALVRDGFQCIITRTYDYLIVRQSAELKQEVTDSHVATTATKCVHIFPTAVAEISGIDDKDTKHEYAPSIWTIMTYFGFEDLPEKLVGNGIHELENVMTLDLNFAFYFETLQVWFEAIDDQDNTYGIQAGFKPILLSCGENPITLTSEHPGLPLPNRTFLAIHAACCRIADLSGAGDYIEKTLREMGDIGKL